MDLDRPVIISGLVSEYERFAELIGGLDEDQWATQTRCTEFEVRDVAGHVVGLAEDVVAGKPGSRTSAEEAASVRSDHPTQAAARLTAAIDGLRGLAAALDDDEVWSGPSGVAELSMGDGVLSLWCDTYIHADDILDALGRAPNDGPGLVASLVFIERELAGRGWGPARVDLAPPHAAAGPLIVGDADAPARSMDAHEFMLVATGRLDPVAAGFGPEVNIFAA